jgi:hypothetical protein
MKTSKFLAIFVAGLRIESTNAIASFFHKSISKNLSDLYLSSRSCVKTTKPTNQEELSLSKPQGIPSTAKVLSTPLTIPSDEQRKAMVERYGKRIADNEPFAVLYVEEKKERINIPISILIDAMMSYPHLKKEFNKDMISFLVKNFMEQPNYLINREYLKETIKKRILMPEINYGEDLSSYNLQAQNDPEFILQYIEKHKIALGTIKYIHGTEKYNFQSNHLNFLTSHESNFLKQIFAAAQWQQKL